MASQQISSTQLVGIFDQHDQGRIGYLTSDEGMVELGDALALGHDICTGPDPDFVRRVKANSLIEDYTIRIANLALDSTLEGSAKRDLELRDDIRWRVRPSVVRGLVFGHKAALELLNG